MTHTSDKIPHWEQMKKKLALISELMVNEKYSQGGKFPISGKKLYEALTGRQAEEETPDYLFTVPVAYHIAFNEDSPHSKEISDAFLAVFPEYELESNKIFHRKTS
jgi:hypothetical protein